MNTDNSTLDGYRIEILKMDQLDEAIEIYNKYFIPGEALCSGLHKAAGSLDAYMDEMVVKCISSGVSICIIHEESGKIVCIALSKLLTRDSPDAYDPARNHNERSVLMSKLLNKLQTAYDVFEDESINKVYELAFTTTDKNFAGKGLATCIKKKTFEVAKNTGCQAVLSQATGVTSQRINQRIGFKTMAVLPYDTLTVDGKSVLDLDHMHGATQATMDLKLVTDP